MALKQQNEILHKSILARGACVPYCDVMQMRHVDLVDPSQAGLDPAEAASAPAQPQKWKALPKFPREAGKPWATVWPGPQHVIFGHHARRRLQAHPC